MTSSESPLPNMRRPLSLWLLIASLGLLGLGGMGGGSAMLADPTGGWIQLAAVLPLLPVPDFTWPGMFLLVVMGLVPLGLAYALFRRVDADESRASRQECQTVGARAEGMTRSGSGLRHSGARPNPRLPRPPWPWAQVSVRRAGMPWAWAGSVVVGVVLLAWLALQGLLIGFRWPVQYVTAAIGCSVVVLALSPSVRNALRVPAAPGRGIAPDNSVGGRDRSNGRSVLPNNTKT